MRTRVLLVASILLIQAVAANAASVTVGFTAGTTTGSSPDAINASGTYTESGVNVDWSYIDDFVGVVSPNFTGFTLLSDCGPFGGCGGYGTSMTVSPAGGGTFSLQGIDTSATYEAFSVFADFTPFAADGTTLDYSATVSASAPLLRPSLSLTGVKSDGTLVSATASTAGPANFNTGQAFPDNSFGPAAAMFGPGILASMSDLTSLTIAIDTSSSLNLASVNGLLQFGAPSQVLQGLNQCGFQSSCTIPGAGVFSFSPALIGGRNDTLAVNISGITIDVTAPAPVPLPASALLLLAGLGGLAMLRQRRRPA